MKNYPLDNGQFIISYELLQLLEWLLHHEQDMLKQLVLAALEQGLQKKLLQASRQTSEQIQKAGEEMKQSAVDFFTLLESLMIEAVHERKAQDTVSRSLIPALDHMDLRLYDPHTMSQSVAKVHTAIHKKNGEKPEEVLYRELLKRWKPAKKANLN